MIALDTENRWFRYHHLFQQLLQDQLNRHWSPEEIAAIHSRGTAWFAENDISDEAVKDVPPPRPPTSQPLVDPLTNRELDVLDLLAQRLSNNEIADKLFISPKTVKKHLNNIYGKLNVRGRRQAVDKGYILGILTRH